MTRLYLVIFVLQLALVVGALISCLSTEDGDINAIPRLWWILIILFFPLVGSIAWFAVGRTRTTRPRKTWRSGGGFPEAERPRRPIAPDDDPEFLRSLKPEKRDDDQPKG
jgi:hypothetical protein